MSAPVTPDNRPVHFVGIAGAGMSALAELYVRRGVTVSGCDTTALASADLERLGVHVMHGHDASHVSGAQEVIVTSAVPKDHPELQRARELGIPVTRRAEALGRAVARGVLVGIAGTHGKTSTTFPTHPQAADTPTMADAVQEDARKGSATTSTFTRRAPTTKESSTKKKAGTRARTLSFKRIWNSYATLPTLQATMRLS